MPRILASAIFGLGLAAVATFAAEAPIPANERAKMLAELRADVATLTEALAKAPREIGLLSRRGDCHLFLGQPVPAIADFEKMIALDPAQDAPHWRLGIAYHFAGDFAKSAQQFAKYHHYDSRDRENGIWKFLADVKLAGLEPARRQMLTYTRFDREPFPALYAMFAGNKSTADLFAEIAAKDLTGDPRVMFFANYYAGLNEEVLGHRARAMELLHAAVANPWGRTAENGPAYMWQCARLHYEALSAAR